MSLCVGKSTFCVPTRSDTNRTVQSQKMARGWIFWIKKVEELYYPIEKTKVICAFVFAYADCWFSHAAAHIIVNKYSPDVDLYALHILNQIAMTLYNKLSILS